LPHNATEALIFLETQRRAGLDGTVAREGIEGMVRSASQTARAKQSDRAVSSHSVTAVRT